MDHGDPIASVIGDGVLPTSSGPPRALWPLPTWLWVLLAVFIAKQCVAVVAFPPFSGHDEIAHLAYARILANEHRLPILPELEAWRDARRAIAQTDADELLLPGDDLPSDLYPWCRFVLDWYCEPEVSSWAENPPRVVTVAGEYYPSGFVYTANHPPLAYATMAPLVWLTNGWEPMRQQAALRLWAIPFGVVVVLAGWVLAMTLFPGDRFLATTVPLALAFQPQISYEAGLINNDIAGIAAVSVIVALLAMAMRDRFRTRQAIAIGVVIGLGMLTRSNTVIIVPAVVLGVVLSRGWRDWRGVLSTLMKIGIPAFFLVLPWWAWMATTYGSIDGLNRIGELQQWWNTPEGSFFGLLTDPSFVLMRFKETWGEYGWRLIHLGSGLLITLGLVTLLSLVGLVLWGVLVLRGAGLRNDSVEHPAQWQTQVVVVLVVSCVVAYAAVVQFGTAFALTQARYYFPVAAPAALLCMLGLRTVLPVRFRPWGPWAAVVGWCSLTLLLFFGYVLPFHASIALEMPWITK